MSTYVNPAEQTSNTKTDTTPATLAPVAAKVWSVERVRGLGVTTTLATAASVLGISRSQAYRLAAIDAFPAPLIRAGTRIIVPVAGLLRLLLLHDDPVPTNGGRRLDPAIKVSVDATTAPPADSTHQRWRHRAEHPGDDE